ncbi:EscE/YscE/SsaE family type III secretion system needle protein co-chaperone [Endozoicomonas sp. 4G]|uniref:EscE/YscE/SsaE family type III secretion system needle protein co-chaperone n=1 Tax=Endozoicomonas sp. 4G TaxID=2872754 RepID=UPI00207908E9|nr:EscE/YscE/SsaE family type III secretion system needle protein co-chaperone [Endozoicomonas sp. 4G]
MKDPQTDNEKVRLSGLEDRLILDTDGELREQVLQELVDEAFRLKSERDKGLSPDEFETNNKMITALMAAVEVVDKTWNTHHKKS